MEDKERRAKNEYMNEISMNSSQIIKFQISGKRGRFSFGQKNAARAGGQVSHGWYR